MSGAPALHLVRRALRRPSTRFLLGTILATVAMMMLSYAVHLPQSWTDVLLHLSGMLVFAAFLAATGEERTNP